MQERCLQMKIGSCNGCNVQAMAQERLRLSRNGVAEKQIVQLSEQLCPENAEMKLPKRQEPSIW